MVFTKNFSIFSVSEQGRLRKERDCRTGSRGFKASPSGKVLLYSDLEISIEAIKLHFIALLPYDVPTKIVRV